MDEKSNIELLKEMIDTSSNIVFFGGAGVSTESDIPDFRSSNGLYNEKNSYSKYKPEEILSHTFFEIHTKEFFDFYRDKMLYPNAKPNECHNKLAYLEDKGKLKAVITQNIDGLHEKAGSKNVLTLHGSVMRNYCMACNKFFDLDFILNSKGIPKCECGGVIKPDVVLYEEPLDMSIWSSAIRAVSKADMLIIGGTSLAVYPAASLIEYYSGNKLVIINRDATLMDNRANLVIRENIGKVFSNI